MPTSNATSHKSAKLRSNKTWFVRFVRCWKAARGMLLRQKYSTDETGLVEETRSLLLEEEFNGLSHEDDSTFASEMPEYSRDRVTGTSSHDVELSPNAMVDSMMSPKSPNRIAPLQRTNKRTIELYHSKPSESPIYDSWLSLVDDPTPTNTHVIPTKVAATNVRPPRFVRNRTVDSFAGSLESIDSLAESYWDPEDDTSLPLISPANEVVRSREFFQEHVHFLKVQTQPRQVEVVWTKE